MQYTPQPSDQAFPITIFHIPVCYYFSRDSFCHVLLPYSTQAWGRPDRLQEETATARGVRSELAVTLSRACETCCVRVKAQSLLSQWEPQLFQSCSWMVFRGRAAGTCSLPKPQLHCAPHHHAPEHLIKGSVRSLLFFFWHEENKNALSFSSVLGKSLNDSDEIKKNSQYYKNSQRQTYCGGF